jgi:hypothetical protein
VIFVRVETEKEEKTHKKELSREDENFKIKKEESEKRRRADGKH